MEAMYERSPAFFKPFQKNKSVLYRKNPIFPFTRSLTFAFVLRVSNVIITLLIITTFSSTCRSFSRFYRINKTVFSSMSFYNFQVSSHLRIHWRRREMFFFKNSCWQWSTTKAMSTDTQKQAVLLPHKSVCQRLPKISKQNSKKNITKLEKVW